MSAGGFIGMWMNLAFFAVFWSILGIVVDKIAVIFNTTIRFMPSYQDAVTGFQVTQVVYGSLPVIVFIFLLINYFVNENSSSSGEV